MTGWSGGGCSGTAETCTVSLASGNQAVTATFGPAAQPVTVNVPAGVSFSLNGTTYTGSQTVNLAPGSYILSTTSPQALAAGSRAEFVSWSNNQPITHSISVASAPLTITATFKTQYQLTTAASPSNGGTVTPASGNFYDSGTVVPVTATPNYGFAFASWTGPVASGNVTMDAPKSITANFTALQGVTVNVPAGVSFSLNGTTYTGSQTVNLAPGLYTLSTSSPQMLAPGTQAVFQSWSNNQPISHSITVAATPLTITGTFKTQFQLTTSAGTGGTVSPASGNFYDAGTVVPVTATPSIGYVFASWTGPVVNGSVTMDAPKSITANFTAIVIAPNVTAQFTVTLGVPAFNRGTGRFSQLVSIVNNGPALSAAAFVLDQLAAGYTVHQPSGVTVLAAPVGSAYREIGPIAAGSRTSFTIEFTRVGSPALTYTPRILGVGSR